jgi:HEAT repeat protein
MHNKRVQRTPSAPMTRNVMREMSTNGSTIPMSRIDRLLASCLTVVFAIVGCGPAYNGERMQSARQRLNPRVNLTVAVKRVSDSFDVSWALKNELAMPIWIPVLWQFEYPPKRMPLVFWNTPDELVLVFGKFKRGKDREGLIRWGDKKSDHLPEEVDGPCKYKKILPGEIFGGTITLALPYRRESLKRLPNPFLYVKHQDRNSRAKRSYWNGPAIPQGASRLWVAVEYSLHDPKNPADRALDYEIAQRYVANALISGDLSGPIVKDPLASREETVALAVSNVVKAEIPFQAPSKDVIDQIIRGLGDEDRNVRWVATGSVIDVGLPAKAATEKLIEMLQNEEDPDIRTNVVQALGSIGPPAKKAIPLLIAALDDIDVGVSAEAAAALGNIGGSNSAIIKTLIESMSTKKKHVIHSAARILGRLGVSEHAFIDKLIKMLKSSDYSSRLVAAGSLFYIGPAARKAIPTLLEMMKSKDVHERTMAVQALGAIGPEARKAMPTLLEMLKSKNVNERIMAVQALGDFGPEARNTLPALRILLKDKDSEVRDAAAWAIKKIQDK